ncbi:Os04g0524950 [Oryza sativa Japonica Group]|uniref:Os04g0524950 protein n=1 Tax=Oryza sativa subsp. japonica TaxID=39947 RepID=A0A0P0WCI8_ORYSJ|nr:Os04g0524950 [Oryza sativa Japonica Group]
MGDATIPRPPPKLQPAILRRSAPISLSHSLLLASHPSWLRALGQIEAVAADGGNPQRKGRRSGTPVEGGSTLERSCGGNPNGVERYSEPSKTR